MNTTIKRTLFSLVLLFSFSSFGQQSEGQFEFRIDVKAMDTSAQKRQMAGLLYGSYLKMSFMPGASKVELKFGQFGTNTVVEIQGKDSVMQTTNGPMGKFVMYHTPENYAESQKGKQVNLAVELIDETKKILGFTCKKAIARQGGNLITYWYTDAINISVENQQFVNPNIPGFPLEFSTIDDEIFMRFRLVNYKEVVPNKQDTFSIYPGPEYLVTLPQY